MEEQTNEIRRQWKDRDRVVKAMTKDGLFRAAVVLNRIAAVTAQRRHGLDALCSLLLARALSGATLMASFLKGEERVSVSADGDGIVKSVFAEAIQVGEVRGFCLKNSNPTERSGPLGEGLLKVQRFLYDKNEPVTGIVELERGDITTDLSHYLTQSEQIPSVFMLDVAFDHNDLITQSVGILVQAMPGARPEDIFKTYDILDMLERPTEFAEKGYSPEDIVKQVLPGEIEILDKTAVDFFCRCSLERFKGVLLTLGYDEVVSMEKAGHNELVCQYCNEQYHLSEQDFTELKELLLARRN